MNKLKVIGNGDTAAAGEIVAHAHTLLEDIDLPELVTPDLKTPERIGVSGVCIEASDAVTRAAHELGILASRECHTGYHCFTSFAPLDSPPGEEDPIICLTWGQFKLEEFLKRPAEFFGKRRDICPLVGVHYEDSYASWTTELRQVTNTFPAKPSLEHVWLRTTPEDIANRAYPIGQVERTKFPEDAWEPELVFSSAA
jgi:hypothetical protein